MKMLSVRGAVTIKRKVIEVNGVPFAKVICDALEVDGSFEDVGECVLTVRPIRANQCAPEPEPEPKPEEKPADE